MYAGINYYIMQGIIISERHENHENGENFVPQNISCAFMHLCIYLVEVCFH